MSESKIPGRLLNRRFDNFASSRNYCLDRVGTRCKYTIMPDDSYILMDGEGLINQLSKITKVILSIKILNTLDSQMYYSSRITLAKTSSKFPIRYTGEIHEYIPYDPNIQLQGCYILDEHCEAHMKRSKQRFINDVQILSKQENSRRKYYYLGLTYLRLDNEEAAIYWLKCRAEWPEEYDDDKEERMLSQMYLANLIDDKNIKQSVSWYLKAAITYSPRAGECYFFIFLLTGNEFYLRKAKKSPLGVHRLPVNYEIYNQIHLIGNRNID
jgi:hypothetical protein